MKNFVLLIAVMVVSACASTPTIKSVAGTYEAKKDGDTFRVVFLENGNSEVYKNGKKEAEGKWKLSKESEIHITTDEGGTGVFVWRQVALLDSEACPYLVCRTIPPCFCGIRAHNRRDD